MRVKHTLYGARRQTDTNLCFSRFVSLSDTPHVFSAVLDPRPRSSVCPVLAITFSVLMGGGRELIVAVAARLVQILRPRVSAKREKKIVFKHLFNCGRSRCRDESLCYQSQCYDDKNNITTFDVFVGGVIRTRRRKYVTKTEEKREVSILQILNIFCTLNPFQVNSLTSPPLKYLYYHYFNHFLTIILRLTLLLII